MKITLPIDELPNGVRLDHNTAREIGESLSGSYLFEVPFPHIVIDEFLPSETINNILNNFPSETDSDINFSGNPFQHRKRQILPYACNQAALNYFLFFNSAPFLQFLEGITGIHGLISDPYFVGGGFHEISKGGMLGIHADFRIQNSLHLNRRVNMLIYLNKDWLSEFGGNLEIWDKKMSKKIKDIEPIFNRCVIFNTDADSYHGHPDPLNTPDEITRKSMAFYYYTASKTIYTETPNLGTQFQARTDTEKKQFIQAAIKNRFTTFVVNEILPPFIYKSLRLIKRFLRKH
jgi:Rps23 Pro-64 3,4-dihydroxylase Tpa1-like proline 4-hydroxylase